MKLTNHPFRADSLSPKRMGTWVKGEGIGLRAKVLKVEPQAAWPGGLKSLIEIVIQWD